VQLTYFVSNTEQKAFGCSCISHSPQTLDEKSDVIFIGIITDKERGPLENALHVKFHVSKSWKGIDTQSVTIHIDDPQCSPPFFADREYLVYSYKDLFEIRMPACSGTTVTENTEIVQPEIQYLDTHYTPITLKIGRTESLNILPVIEIIAAIVGISIVAFLVIARHR
jgi:hypothetical protein